MHKVISRLPNFKGLLPGLLWRHRLAHGAFYNTASHRASTHKNISTIIFIQGIKTNFLLPGPALAAHSLYHWNGLLTTEVQAWRRDLRLLILGLGCGRGGWGRGSVGHLSHHFLEAFLDHSSSYNVPSLKFSSASLAIPPLAYRSNDLGASFKLIKSRGSQEASDCFETNIWLLEDRAVDHRDNG